MAAELSAKDRVRIARREQKLAAEAEVRRQAAIGQALDLQAQLDAVRGEALELPTAIAQGDLTRVSMVLWLQNVTVLSDLARNAPSERVRMDSANYAAQRSHEMLKLIAEGQGQLGGKVVEAERQTQPTDGLTPEEKTAFVRQHLKLARSG